MMKSNKLLIISAVLLFVINVLPQECRESDVAELLEKKVQEGNFDAILDAGNSSNKCYIPYLKKLASKGSNYAKIALAKLGDEDSIKKILIQSDSKEEYERSLGMDSLVRVGGKTAFKKLYEKLLELKPLPDSDEKSSIMRADQYEGAYELFHYLKRLVGDKSPKVDVGTKNYWTVQLNLWKKWFEENKELIQ